MGVKFDWIKRPGGFLKIINLLFAIICVGLFFSFGTYKPIGHAPRIVKSIGIAFGVDPDEMTAAIVSAYRSRELDHLTMFVLSCNLFILLYYLISFIAGESYPADYPISEMMFLVIHALLTLVAGCSIFDLREPKKDWVHYAYFVLSLLMFILFLVDAFFAFKDSR